MITTSPTTEELSPEELTAEVSRLDIFTGWVLRWLDLHYPSEPIPERIQPSAPGAHRNTSVA